MVVSGLATSPAQRRPLPFRKKIRRAKALFRAGDPVGSAKWLWLSLRDSWGPVRVAINGHPILLRASSNDISIALENLSGEFDELIARMPELTHGLIIDAGGYLGTAAIALAEAYPAATIVTIEPSPENFALLRRNTASYANIVPCNKALGGRSGHAELKDRGYGYAGLTVSDPTDSRLDSVIARVERVTIAELLEQFGCDGIDILKLDIEGGEVELLNGNIDWLERTGAICIELHDRIVPGCSGVWTKVTAGRRNTKLKGEKYLSLAA